MDVSFQTRRRHRLKQVLRNQRVHSWDPGDIDDGDKRRSCNDPFEEVFHHHLRARAVEGADERQR